MKIRSVCILGGTGFVGRAVACHAAALGMRVRVVTRSRPRAMALTVLPTVEVMVADALDPEALAACVEGMDAVVNLVGILHPRGRTGFREAHVELPRRIALACHGAGVRHVVHMSALGADPAGPSEYQRSKGEGEAALRAAAGSLAWTILRPSVIFGADDRFLNTFATLVRWFPVIPLAGARARFQPIWVEDVARCFAQALGDPRTFGQAYELCGPKSYALGELVQLVAHTLGRRRRVLALPAPLARLQALTLEMLPGRLMTRDNLRSMAVDNVCACAFPPVFGFAPAPLEAVLPEYLAGTAARSRYPRFRHNAGR